MKRILLTVIVAGLLLVSACSSPDSNAETGTLPGNMAPDFRLNSLEGQPLALSDYRGSPVVLNFWATWCGPCRQEMPLLQSAHEQWSGEGLVLIGIDSAEPAERVRAFVDEVGLTFSVVIDPDNRVFLEYNIRAIPTTFFLDKDGIIKSVKVGAFFDEGEINSRIEEIMD